jgi:hypothetical protein
MELFIGKEDGIGDGDVLFMPIRYHSPRGRQPLRPRFALALAFAGWRGTAFDPDTVFDGDPEFDFVFDFVFVFVFDFVFDSVLVFACTVAF